MLSLQRQPLTRAEIYERAQIDHIAHLDAALMQLVKAGQAIYIPGATERWILKRKAA